MKLIRTEEAVGHVLCHDMTQIIKDQYKDARFRKGHIVTEDDIPVLLSMGKENLYVWEMTPGMVHENDAAERLLAHHHTGAAGPSADCNDLHTVRRYRRSRSSKRIGDFKDTGKRHDTAAGQNRKQTALVIPVQEL